MSRSSLRRSGRRSSEVEEACLQSQAT